MLRFRQSPALLGTGTVPALALGLATTLLAVVLGGMSALTGSVMLAVYVVAVFAASVVVFNFSAGVWLLVLAMPFAATRLMPRQVLGITGLNPFNLLLAATLMALLLALVFGRNRIKLVRPPRILLAYLLVIAAGAVIGSFQATRSIPQVGADGSVEFTTLPRYILEVVKPLLIIVVAWLVATKVSMGKGVQGYAMVWAMALSATIFFCVLVAYLAISGTDLQTLASARSRGFLFWMGMHANELGLLANMLFAVLLYTALAARPGLRRTLLFVAAAAAAMTAALTFSRAAFLGLLVITGYFLFSRRRFGQLLAGLTIVALIAVFLPEAFVERATTGVQEQDVRAITAGRLDGIWRPLWPWAWQSPIWGHGLGSTAWAPANLNGGMAPVGHPHSAYLRVFLDTGLVGVCIVTLFFWSMWNLFRRHVRSHSDPVWRGLFEGGSVCVLILLVQGISGDSFLPTYAQSALWLVYGLALGHASLQPVGPSGPRATAP